MLFRPWKKCSLAGLVGRRLGASLACGPLLVFILLILMPPPATVAGQTAVTPDLYDLRVRFQTEARVLKIGRRESRRFETGIELVEDEVVKEYVDRIAQNLASNSGFAGPVTIKVVDAMEVNAVSFPGGFLYISSGLILAVDDEAEIAGVVAHEIAHVIARDGLRNNRYVGGGFGTDPIILGSLAGTGTNVFEGDPTTPLMSPQTLRELDADEQAMAYMQKAGYNPESLLAFLEKMQAEETVGRWEVPPIFQTHPAPAERIRLVRERISADPVTNDPPAGVGAALLDIKVRLMQQETNRPRPE